MRTMGDLPGQGHVTRRRRPGIQDRVGWHRPRLCGRMRIASLLLTGVFGVAATGCAGATEDAAEAQSNATPASVDFTLTVDEFKKVSNSKTDAFAINVDASTTLPCRDRAFAVTTKPSLYEGWDPKKEATSEGGQFGEYIFASCRDGAREVLAWFGKERAIEFIVSEQLIQKDYDPKKLPLLLRTRTLGAGEPTFYACDTAPTKKLIKENDDAKRFDVTFACKKTAAPAKKATGPVDFISDPGPYASLVSFRDWMLPAIPSNKASFDNARKALLAKIPQGSYGGVMRTLSNQCTLTIKSDGDALVIDHTIVSSDRTRHFELKAEDILGFSEGVLFDFDKPLDVGGAKGGTFVAAEFRDKKGESFTLRFEQNDAPENQVMRINGPETFCRRLAKQ
jgi:hypothetical protein